MRGNSARRRRRRERGQMLVLFMLALVVLLGFTAMAIDVGLFLHQRRDLQNDSDAAALVRTETPPPPLELGLSGLTGEAIEEARSKCHAFDFLPENEIQYQWLERLALYVTRAEEVYENDEVVPSALQAEVKEAVPSRIRRARI